MADGKDQISRHEVDVYLTLRRSSAWLSVDEIASMANVGRRTAHAHAKKLNELGLCDVARVYPGYRYRWAEGACNHHAGYLSRLERAAEVLAVARENA